MSCEPMTELIDRSRSVSEGWGRGSVLGLGARSGVAGGVLEVKVTSAICAQRSERQLLSALWLESRPDYGSEVLLAY